METDCTALIPFRPDRAFWPEVRQLGGLDREYLIFRAAWLHDGRGKARKGVRVTCSGCGESFDAERVDHVSGGSFGWAHPLGYVSCVEHFSRVECPVCGRPCISRHVSSLPVRQCSPVLTVSRVKAEGARDRLAVTEWLVIRTVGKDGESEYETRAASAYVVEERKLVRLMGYRTVVSNASWLDGWEQRKVFLDETGGDGFVLWDGSGLEGTTAENSALDRYAAQGGKHLVSYLALWRKRPQVENLVVQGCAKLVDRMIDGEFGRDGRVPKLPEIDWREKRPARMLGLNREEFRVCAGMEWTPGLLLGYKVVRDAGVPVRLPEDAELLKLCSPQELRGMLERIGRLPGRRERELFRALRYMDAQRRIWYTLRDYWDMAEARGRDLGEERVRYPRDLGAAHDREVAEKKTVALKCLEPAFSERAAALDALSFSSDGILIRPCRTTGELVREGEALHHCVAMYAHKHAAGETAILFVRRESEPDKPWFTLEFDEERMEVRQNRGLRNCGRTPEVAKFEAAWLRWVRSAGARRVRVS